MAERSYHIHLALREGRYNQSGSLVTVKGKTTYYFSALVFMGAVIRLRCTNLIDNDTGIVDHVAGEYRFPLDEVETIYFAPDGGQS